MGLDTRPPGFARVGAKQRDGGGESKMKKCPKCSQENQTNWVDCFSCGTKLDKN